MIEALIVLVPVGILSVACLWQWWDDRSGRRAKRMIQEWKIRDELKRRAEDDRQ